MHQFPLDLKIGAQWVKFVQRHRVDINEPINKYASPCSVHFKERIDWMNYDCLPKAALTCSGLRRDALSEIGTEQTKKREEFIQNHQQQQHHNNNNYKCSGNKRGSN
ncbi:hypothetical protein P5673_018905 [Acropora cervicornis]|uniref:Uncharacterized protein n=1 Tax=Acropora cervicornis TaxID=6130 RepID=A0AAD9QD58_ACRCE|nr:hypothetical protein P5673_018905 [Acropora cervicornis]